MTTSDDYLETTTLRQFLDVGGELTFSPDGAVSIVGVIAQTVDTIAKILSSAEISAYSIVVGAIHEALEGSRAVAYFPGAQEQVAHTAAHAALKALGVTLDEAPSNGYAQGGVLPIRPANKHVLAGLAPRCDYTISADQVSHSGRNLLAELNDRFAQQADDHAHARIQQG